MATPAHHGHPCPSRRSCFRSSSRTERLVRRAMPLAKTQQPKAGHVAGGPMKRIRRIDRVRSGDVSGVLDLEVLHADTSIGLRSLHARKRKAPDEHEDSPRNGHRRRFAGPCPLRLRFAAATRSVVRYAAAVVRCAAEIMHRRGSCRKRLA